MTATPGATSAPLVAPTCFVIGPIGSDKASIGTPKYETWAAAQEVLETIILPACDRFGIVPLRADKITRAGEITEQVFVALRDRDLVIADLTGANPNVMYELALRHAIGKCAILITEYERLPYDLLWIRAIEFTRTPLGLIHGRQNLEAQIETFIASDCDRVTATRIIRDGGGAREPSGGPSPGADGHLGPSEEADTEAPGFVDVVAEMESAMPRLSGDISEIGVELTQMGGLAERGTAELADLEAGGQTSMGARLPIIARFATALNASADRLDALTAQYGADIVLVDAGMMLMLNRMEIDPALQGEAPQFLPSLVELGETGRTSFESMDGLAVSIDGLGPLARVLRQPARRVAATLRSVRHVTEPVWTWADRAAAIIASRGDVPSAR